MFFYKIQDYSKKNIFFQNGYIWYCRGPSTPSPSEFDGLLYSKYGGTLNFFSIRMTANAVKAIRKMP